MFKFVAAAATVSWMLLVAGSAYASADVRADTDAAHVYWQTGVAAPEPADANGACRGRWNVIADATLPDRGMSGNATGIGYTHNSAGGIYTDEHGNRWDWHIARCEFTLDPALHGGERRCVIIHEIGHFVHGPWHRGLMDIDTMRRCIDAARDEQAAAAAAAAEARRARHLKRFDAAERRQARRLRTSRRHRSRATRRKARRWTSSKWTSSRLPKRSAHGR